MRLTSGGLSSLRSGTCMLQHALAILAEERLVVLRQGRTAVVAGDVVVDRRAAGAARGRDHDCKRAGCQPHVCRPLTAKTIRNIHSILSGAFSTAERWEWISWNAAESAKPPTVTRRPVPATAPEDVAKVIAEGRKTHPAMALYLCSPMTRWTPIRGILTVLTLLAYSVRR